MQRDPVAHDPNFAGSYLRLFPGAPTLGAHLLVVLMVPSAIVSNAIRIMGAGMMAHRFGPAAAEGFLHGFSGWVIFLVALLLLFAFHWILRHIGKVPRKAAHA